jgi:hypothetical protein
VRSRRRLGTRSGGRLLSLFRTGHFSTDTGDERGNYDAGDKQVCSPFFCDCAESLTLTQSDCHGAEKYFSDC